MALPPQVCAQLCRRPCYCPWVPPRCPRGSPLVLDGCGCCRICARRLGEPCDFLHVCDQSQGLVCDYSTAAAGTGATCNCEQRAAGQLGCRGGWSRGGTGVPKMLLSPCRGWSLGVLQGNFRQTSSSLKPLNGRVGGEGQWFSHQLLSCCFDNTERGGGEEAGKGRRLGDTYVAACLLHALLSHFCSPPGQSVPAPQFPPAVPSATHISPSLCP